MVLTGLWTELLLSYHILPYIHDLFFKVTHVFLHGFTIAFGKLIMFNDNALTHNELFESGKRYYTGNE